MLKPIPFWNNTIHIQSSQPLTQVTTADQVKKKSNLKSPIPESKIYPSATHWHTHAHTPNPCAIYVRPSVIACVQDKNLSFYKRMYYPLDCERGWKTPLFKSIAKAQVPVEGKYREP